MSPYIQLDFSCYLLPKWSELIDGENNQEPRVIFELTEAKDPK